MPLSPPPIQILARELSTVWQPVQVQQETPPSRSRLAWRLGNIVSRSDLTPLNGYTYNPSGIGSIRPHALTQLNLSAGGKRTYQYDANGSLTTETQYDAANNVIANKGRAEYYTSFNMPNAMGSPGLSLAFYYGPEHQRIKQISSSQGTTYYLNPGNNGDLLFEKDIKPDNSTEQRNYITAYGQVVAMVKLTNGATWTTRYLHRDNLGSVTTVTDETGTVIERLAYEPFGKRRFATGSDDTNNTIVPQNTDRGYTNHEHLDELTLIHMNGRVYDPVAGRFMSADPHIQDPLNLQSYNRYAYVMNNPLMYTDPSGYFSLSKAWKSVWKSSVGRIAITVAVAYFTGYYDGGIFGASGALSGAGLTGNALAIANGAAGGFAGSFVGSGGDFKAGIIGGITGGAMGWVGGAYPGPIENVVAHAAVGCASSSMSGGSCGSGALAGGFSAAAAPFVSSFGVVGGTVASAVVGGTASVLGGGKFANGAQTGAFGYLFNFMLHRDARINQNVGQRYSLKLDESMGEFYLQETKPLFKRFTGWIGKLASVAELGVDKIVPGVGTQELASFTARRDAARLDVSIAGIVNELGFSTGKSGLSSSQVETLMRTIDQKLPEFKDHYGESALNMLNRLNSK